MISQYFFNKLPLLASTITRTLIIIELLTQIQLSYPRNVLTAIERFSFHKNIITSTK
uniref:Uncharacterized protein n=1 Tax=Rhizophagus irregularis (strain DAOM 181602 / DAOM 197198 / MUCL 43194) TaxID=747089 RepID=U9U8K3_RHIID